MLALILANPVFAGAPDAREIVARSVDLDQANWARMRNYTWTARETTRRLDSAGAVRSTETEQWETVILFGRPYRKITARNGKPLSAAEQQREQDRIDRAVQQWERESPDQRAARLAREEKERLKEREFLKELPEAFRFRLEGQENIDGRSTWVISAEPDPAFRPKHSDAKAFRQIEGRIWIDQEEFQWVRIEARTTGVISWGWFLARLDPGASLVFEQARVNDEIWLPKTMRTAGSGRLGLVKKLRQEQEVVWTNYRKFQAESKLVSSP